MLRHYHHQNKETEISVFYTENPRHFVLVKRIT